MMMRKGVRKTEKESFIIEPPKNFLSPVSEVYLYPLKYLDFVNEDGDSFAYIENYDETQEIKPEHLSRMLTSNGLVLFTLQFESPEMLEKIDMQVIKDNPGIEPYLAFNLNAVLGLPGNEPQKEVEELKNFLIFLKDEAMNHLGERVGLCMSRGFGPTKLEISVDDNDKLENSLNQKMNEKINQSAVLKQWVANQKLGIENTCPHLDNLWASLDTVSLMNRQEQNLWEEALSSKPKNNLKPALRKVKKKF